MAMIVNGYEISNVIDSINSNCLYKNEGWFRKHIEKGFFIGHLPVDSDIMKIADIIEDMIKSLNAIHKENWAFFFKNPHSLPEIHILYPIIDITNSENKHHTIRDLVIKLSIGIVNRKLFLNNCIEGMRLTVSKPEFISGYRHSHLHSLHYRNYKLDFNVSRSDFCMGTNEIPEIMTVFNDSQEAGTFELLLLALENMLSWESLEGVPYISIKSISSRVASEQSYYPGSRDAHKVFNCIIDKNFLKASNFDMRLNRIRIIEDDAFQERLLLKVFENCPEIICIRNEIDYSSFMKARMEDNNIICPDIHFKFKNKDIHFKVYDNVKESIEEKLKNINYIIHPTVYTEAIKQVNKYIYEKCVRKYAIENGR